MRTFVVLLVLCAGSASAQTGTAAGDPRNIAGAWEPMRGGPGAPPPTPPSPITLKAPYAAEWQARRAAQDEATKKGEPLATLGSQCVPYGMPTMMAVANYPVEILPTAGQVTIVTEAFSEVRRNQTLLAGKIRQRTLSGSGCPLCSRKRDMCNALANVR